MHRTQFRRRVSDWTVAFGPSCSTHISNYQSSEHESNQHDESDMMKFSCSLKNALLIIRDRFGLSFATKGLGYLAAYYLLLPLLACCKLSCYQTTCYRLF